MACAIQFLSDTYCLFNLWGGCSTGPSLRTCGIAPTEWAAVPNLNPRGAAPGEYNPWVATSGRLAPFAGSVAHNIGR